MTARIQGRTYEIPEMWVVGFCRTGRTISEAVNHWHEQELMQEQSAAQTLAAEVWTLFDITFRAPDEREIVWSRFAPSMDRAIEDFRALLVREFPNGKGGTWARLKRVAPRVGGR